MDSLKGPHIGPVGPHWAHRDGIFLGGLGGLLADFMIPDPLWDLLSFFSPTRSPRSFSFNSARLLRNRPLRLGTRDPNVRVVPCDPGRVEREGSGNLVGPRGPLGHFCWALWAFLDPLFCVCVGGLLGLLGSFLDPLQPFFGSFWIL